MVKQAKNNLGNPITSKAGESRHLFPAADQYKRERQNFRKMKDNLELDPELRDKFVAVQGNKVVGSSDERFELSIEMAKRFPKGSYFIGKVYSQGKGN